MSLRKAGRLTEFHPADGAATATQISLLGKAIAATMSV